MESIVAENPTYTGEQIAVAARELRQAAGADEERFTNAQAISMLSEEIRLLRERGFSEAQIADLFQGFDISVTPGEIQQHSRAPRFVE
jgi:hypothetical protein